MTPRFLLFGLGKHEVSAHAVGIMIWDATPFLQEWARKGEKLTWTDDSHPNALGHRRIAEYVAGILHEHERESISSGRPWGARNPSARITE